LQGCQWRRKSRSFLHQPSAASTKVPVQQNANSGKPSDKGWVGVCVWRRTVELNLETQMKDKINKVMENFPKQREEQRGE
jgi:hypothetical protein